MALYIPPECQLTHQKLLDPLITLETSFLQSEMDRLYDRISIRSPSSRIDAQLTTELPNFPNCS